MEERYPLHIYMVGIDSQQYVAFSEEENSRLSETDKARLALSHVKYYGNPSIKQGEKLIAFANNFQGPKEKLLSEIEKILIG